MGQIHKVERSVKSNQNPIKINEHDLVFSKIFRNITKNIPGTCGSPRHAQVRKLEDNRGEYLNLCVYLMTY